METYALTIDYVMHMEIDLEATENDPSKTHLMYAEHRYLGTAFGNQTSIIVGSPEEGGYWEGEGISARFRYITSFTQLNATTVVVVDSWSHCLRLVDKTTSETTPFLGKCGKPGSPEQFPPGFYYPRNVLYDTKSNSLIVTEWLPRSSLYSIELVTAEVTVLMKDNLRRPSGMTFDYLKENIFITGGNSITRFNMEMKTETKIVGSSKHGFRDGPLSTAIFDWPAEIVSLSEGILVVADSANHRLRVIEFDGDGHGQVTSICTGDFPERMDGPISLCTVNAPEGLLYAAGMIYIGEVGSIRRIHVQGW